MTVQELARKYREMRKLQAAYFKTRTQSALEASKASERELDRDVSEVLDPPTLFGREAS